MLVLCSQNFKHSIIRHNKMKTKEKKTLNLLLENIVQKVNCYTVTLLTDTVFSINSLMQFVEYNLPQQYTECYKTTKQ